jgi:hypothetical protein
MSMQDEWTVESDQLTRGTERGYVNTGSHYLDVAYTRVVQRMQCKCIMLDTNNLDYSYNKQVLPSHLAQTSHLLTSQGESTTTQPLDP